MKTIHEATETLTSPKNHSTYADGIHAAYVSLRGTLVETIREMRSNTRPAYGTSQVERSRMNVNAERAARSAKAVARAMVEVVRAQGSGTAGLKAEADAVRDWVYAEADEVIEMVNARKRSVFNSVAEKYFPPTSNPLPDGRYSATGVNLFKR